jgi:hypothetical protein
MSRAGNIWENNISKKHKQAVAKALGLDVIRIIEEDLKSAEIGRDNRIQEAIRKCKAKKEERTNPPKQTS